MLFVSLLLSVCKKLRFQLLGRFEGKGEAVGKAQIVPKGIRHLDSCHDVFRLD